jgi:hypothetical protein
MGQVYQCWLGIGREKSVYSRLEYHTFYVFYQFVTYILTLPPSIYLRYWRSIHIYDVTSLFRWFLSLC